MTSYAIDAPQTLSTVVPTYPRDRVVAGLYLALALAGVAFLTAVAALALA